MAGEESASLEITGATTADSGDYYCEVEITANAQTANSDVATLTVMQPPAKFMHMPMNNSPDDIVGPVTPTVVGDPLTYTGGQDGQAVVITPSNEQVQYANPIAGFTGLTVAAWMNPLYPSMTNIRFISQLTDAGVSGAGPWEWELAQSWETAGTLMLTLQLGGENWQYLNSASSLPAETWTHVAFTYDGADGAMVLYVNGEEDASATYAVTGMPDCSGLIELNSKASWWGNLDEVRIYNFALNAYQMEYLYAGKACVAPPALDLDGDCVVDLNELAMIAGAWLEEGFSTDFPEVD